MNKVTGALALVLGVSILVNGLTVAELTKLRAKQLASPTKARGDAASPASATPDAPVAADNSAVLSELRKIRSEIAAMREGHGASPSSPGRGAGAQPGVTELDDLPASVANDPAVAKLLVEQEALNKLWRDLQKISGLQKSLGEEKHRSLVMKMTGEFLGLDASARAGFETAAAQMSSELDAANKAMQDSSKTMTYDQKDPAAYQRVYADMMKRYNDARKAAESRLDPYLTSSSRHQQFKQNLQTWGWYVNPTQYGNGDYSGIWPQAVQEDK